MELPDQDSTLTPELTLKPTPPPQPSALHWIFLGKDGPRAGWSLLIFIALLTALLFCVTTIGHKFHLTPPRREAGSAIAFTAISTLGEAVPFLVLLLVTWIMSKIERRPNSVYGLGGGRRLPYFFAGLAWGVAFLSLLVFTLWKTGLLVVDGRLLFGSAIVRYGAIWLLGFLLVGLTEEYLTRGYLQ